MSRVQAGAERREKLRRLSATVQQDVYGVLALTRAAELMIEDGIKAQTGEHLLVLLNHIAIAAEQARAHGEDIEREVLHLDRPAAPAQVKERVEWRRSTLSGLRLTIWANEQAEAEALAASHGLVADIAERATGTFEVLVIFEGEG